MYLSFGCDPEFLCLNTEGYPIISYKYIGGDKDISLPFGVLYPDGYAAEMKVDPGMNYQEICDNIEANIKYIRGTIGDISYNPVIDITEEEIKSSCDYGRGRLDIIGCRKELPLYDSYMCDIDPLRIMYRTFGGHIHIGFNDYPFLQEYSNVQKLVSLLDSTIGLVSVLMNPGEDFKRRKNLYGRAGYHRVYQTKEGTHVVEYRVLPSISLLRDSVLYFHITELVSKYCFQILKEDFFSLFDGMENCVKRASIINEHNPESAKRSIVEFGKYIPGFLDIITDYGILKDDKE